MRGGFIWNCGLVVGILVLGPSACCPQDLEGKLQPETIAKWNQPLFFARLSKTDRAIEYTAITSSATAVFLKDGVAFQTTGFAFQLKFLDSNHATEPRGEDPQAARVNFFMGDQAQDWLTDLPTYQAVVYRSMYPGIDVRFGFSGTHLKSDFVVAPGSDPSRIRFRYTGLDRPRIDQRGNAIFESSPGSVHEEAPIVFQWKHGARVPVTARFKLSDDDVVSFELGAFDRTMPLTIDPVVSYSSYLGGTGDSAATAIAADPSGNVYIAGWTDSLNFPTAGPIQGANAGIVNTFVLKLNAAGNSLLYATYIGGGGDDRAYGIAIDGGGNAYITGSTTSSNFPTHSPIQSALKGTRDAFVLGLNAGGNALTFSTYWGGTGVDYGYAIAVDAQGNAYVTGDTSSVDFPTLNPFQAANGGNEDAFVSKFSATGALVYSTYLGGHGVDHGGAIAVDASGNAYITGGTFSTNFPTMNAFQGANAGGQDVFVTKLASRGNSLVYSTYLGGSGGGLGAPEWGCGIAVDSFGDAFVTGTTSSTNFPIQAAFQLAAGGGTSTAFVSQMNAQGTALIYSTYLGGSSADFGQAIALDLAGNAYVAGYTASTNFPLAAPVQGALSGGYDAFVVELSAAGNNLNFSTLYGGSGLDAANGIALDMAGNAYIAGQTLSSDFPVVSALQPSLLGSIEGFVVKLNIGSPPNFSISMAPGSEIVAAGGSTTYSVNLAGGNGFSEAVNLIVSGLPSGVTGSFNSTSLTGSGSSILTIDTTAGGSTGTFTATVTGTSGSVAHTASSGLTITGSSGPPAAVSVTPSSGSGMAQTFVFAFTDPTAAANIVSTQMIVDAALVAGGSCYFFYIQGTNVVQLANDAGALEAGLPMGSAGTLQNSQCSLNVGASSVSASGTTLMLSLAVTFETAFAGAKNVYMLALNAIGNGNWVQRGTWTAGSVSSSGSSGPPSAVSVTPSSGLGPIQTFAFVFSDPNAATNIVSTQMIVDAALVAGGSCYFFYIQGTNVIQLASDAGTWQAGLTIGSAGTQQNSQCSLNVGASSVSASGTTLTLKLALSFQPDFGGGKNVYMLALNAAGNSNWVQRGTWTVTPVIASTESSAPPAALSVTPSSGSGTSQTFAFVFSDPAAATNIVSTQMIVDAGLVAGGSCYFFYIQGTNVIQLANDAGALQAGLPMGSAGTLQNSQCSLNVGASSVSASGTNLTLRLALTFETAFAGAKNVYMLALNAAGNSNWVQRGTWTAGSVRSSPVISTLPSAVSVTPSSGSGSVQTFAFVFSDPKAATNILSTQIDINSGLTATAACYFYYSSGANAIYLANDAGAWQTGHTLGSAGATQNSQCSLNVGASSRSVLGTVLTLKLALTFEKGFAGAKNIYMIVQNPAGNGNWVQRGFWTVTPGSP